MTHFFVNFIRDITFRLSPDVMINLLASGKFHKGFPCSIAQEAILFFRGFHDYVFNLYRNVPRKIYNDTFVETRVSRVVEKVRSFIKHCVGNSEH